MFNGATWSLDTSPIFPGSNASPAQVSCTSAKFCMAVRNGYADSWDGSAWSAAVNVVAPVYNFTSVSCPTEGTCVAVSNNAVGYYRDGTWSATEGVDYGSYLSCPGKNFCISVDLRTGAWTYHRGTWSGPVRAGSADEVSCPARNFCMAVDGDAVSYS